MRHSRGVYDFMSIGCRIEEEDDTQSSLPPELDDFIDSSCDSS